MNDYYRDEQDIEASFTEERPTGDTSSQNADSEENKKDFLITIFLNRICEKLKSGCIGIIHRAVKLFRDIVKFFFSSRFFRFIRAILMVILASAAFVILLGWPFFLPLIWKACNSDMTNIVGAVWILLVSGYGAYKGIKGGYWGKIRERWQKRRLEKKARKEGFKT